MIAKQIIRSVLLVVVLGILAIWGNGQYQKSRANAAVKGGPTPVEALPVVAGPQVVVTYFLMGERCESCKKIEALAKETAEKDFPTELGANRVVFRVIDTGEPAHRHYVADYKLTFKTVIISRRLDGREAAWKNMEKVWDLLDDPPAYRSYLATQIRDYLDSGRESEGAAQ